MLFCITVPGLYARHKRLQSIHQVIVKHLVKGIIFYPECGLLGKCTCQGYVVIRKCGPVRLVSKVQDPENHFIHNKGYRKELGGKWGSCMWVNLPGQGHEGIFCFNKHLKYS